MREEDGPGEAVTETAPVSEAPPSGGGIDMQASITILKYGGITVVGMIPAIIVMLIGFSIGSSFAGQGIEQALSGGSESGSTVTIIIGITIMLIVGIICQLQILTFPISFALADSRDDGWRMSYLDTWKTAVEVIVESLPGFGGSFVVVILGLVIESLAVATIGFLVLYLMVIGMIPYIVRKIAAM